MSLAEVRFLRRARQLSQVSPRNSRRGEVAPLLTRCMIIFQIKLCDLFQIVFTARLLKNAISKGTARDVHKTKIPTKLSCQG